LPVVGGRWPRWRDASGMNQRSDATTALVSAIG
jgi:hypothetical protein